MNQDLLKQATRALSQSGHEQQGGRYTRERLMASLHDRRRRSNTRFAVLLPIAAIFVGSTAFAAVTGRLETLMVSALDVVGLVPKTASWSGESPSPTKPRPAVGAGGPARQAASPPEQSLATPAESEPQPAPDVAPDPELSGKLDASAAPTSKNSRERRPVHGGSVDGGSVDGAAVAGGGAARTTALENDAHEVYRRAHAAQFKAHDLAEALSGYEAYLAAQPAGRFAVDARYNRALCLVRLGRRAEAQAELERFARGSYGGYRQADAERLLAALNREQ